MNGDHSTQIPTPDVPEPGKETRFVNGMRLNGRQWLCVALAVSIVMLGMPWLWKKWEPVEIRPDYRIPYRLSKDYWFYERELARAGSSSIALVGDSVIWGEYVRADGTLSYFFNVQCGQPEKFVNIGVNGMFPLALEGLMRDYAKPLHGRKVILHCNMLWLTSPKADLNTDKEERFNHSDLVPQFSPRIPCYKADLNRRLAATVERHFTFAQWANHLQAAYFDQKSILTWTLEEDLNNSSHLAHAYENPFARITLSVPGEPLVDPDRGPSSARHKPWSTTGVGTTRFEWVDLDQSLQWAAFQRLVDILRSRGNNVLVLVGPFNEHMMAEENRVLFRKLRDGIVKALATKHVSYIVPDVLPWSLYADASHPLTEGYQLLAERIYDDKDFKKWLGKP
jgi:hypothetical protein